MFKQSARLLEEKMERPLEEVKQEVLDFFWVRYQNFLLDKGYPFDVIEAVLSISFDELLDVQGRIDALKKLSATNFSNLTPHPFYVFLNYSHPPLLQRVMAIQKVNAKPG
jgi:glycyl-tRNA synthetase beta subunit